MKIKTLFGLELEFVDRVVEIEVPDGRKFFAVQLEDGSFLGQRWEENGDRVYPIHKTKRAAKKALDKYLLTRPETVREPENEPERH